MNHHTHQSVSRKGPHGHLPAKWATVQGPAGKAFLERRACRPAVKAALLAFVMAGTGILVSAAGAQTTRTWTGNAGSATWFASANWDPDSDWPQAGDAVIIPAGHSVLLDEATASLASFTIHTNATLMFTNWTTVLNATSVTIKAGAEVTLPPAFSEVQMSNRVHFAVNDLTLEEGGLIDVDIKGFAMQNGPGKGTTGTRGGGGGYGGRGGAATAGSGGTFYGSLDAPPDPGSGGGMGGSGNAGGAGGGAVRIAASGTVVVDGTIRANGGAGSARGGGGSGGSIFITCSTFGGGTNGWFLANGGDSGGHDGEPGAGAGGRISVTYSELTGAPGVRFSANAGANSWAVTDPAYPAPRRVPEIGSVFFSNTDLLNSVLSAAGGSTAGLNGYIHLDTPKTWSLVNLTVNNAVLGIAPQVMWALSGNLTVTNGRVLVAPEGKLETVGDVTLHHAAALWMYGGSDDGIATACATRVDIGGDLAVNGGATVRVYAGATNNASTVYGARFDIGGDLTIAQNGWIYPYSHATDGGSVRFRMTDMTTAAGGGINADVLGYRGEYGRGKGGNGSRGSGAGYGGRGGDWTTVIGGAPYGLEELPQDPGSGGGKGSAGTGGTGGGLIWLEASGNVIHGGIFTANGTHDAANQRGGGGSGGGITVVCAAFSSTGELHAMGGDRNNSDLSGYYAGAGGGGRIAIVVGLTESELTDLRAGEAVEGLIWFEDPSVHDFTVSLAHGLNDENLTSEQAAQPGTFRLISVQSADTFVLEISGEPGFIGTPAPLGYGVYLSVEAGAALTNAVATPVNEMDGVREACTGWTLRDDQGNTLASNTLAEAVFTMTTNLVLTWSWIHEYELTVTAGINGSVTTDNGWYPDGAVVSVSADADPGYVFVQWLGDLASEDRFDSPLMVTLDQRRTLTATFASQAGEAKTWVGGSGGWESSDGWDPPGIPGPNDDVSIPSGAVAVSTPQTVKSLVLDDGAQIVFTNWNTRLEAQTVLIAGEVTLPDAYTESAASNRVYFSVTDFTLAETGLIDADGKGFAQSNGEGKGGDSSNRAGGGGYGGRGGNGTEINGGITNGTPFMPLAPGSGGGMGGDGNAGAPGGGAVKIAATGAVVIDGEINARGAHAASPRGGGGSGGAIYISGKTVTGGAASRLRVDGGNKGTHASSFPGGGGGGRIAVWINLTEATWTLFLSGSDHLVVMEESHPSFLGMLSKAPGTSRFTWPAAGSPESGTAFFFSPVPVTGSVFMIR